MYTIRSICDTGRACELFDRLTTSDSSLAYQADSGGRGMRVTVCPLGEYDTASTDDGGVGARPGDKTIASADLRNGLYILSVLNQYELEAASPSGSSTDSRALAGNMFDVILFALFARGTAIPDVAVAASDSRAHSITRIPDGCNRDEYPSQL
jgi:hypothetical protein